ncbi:MAG: acyl-CoA synthetase [Nitrososphaerales archaeon]
MQQAPHLPLIERAEKYQKGTAIIAGEGVFTYQQLLESSGKVASYLLDRTDHLKEKCVAFLTPVGFHYVATQWGVWRAGGIVVPLSPLHPTPELEYFIDNSTSSIVVVHPVFEEKLRPLAKDRGLRFILTTDALGADQTDLPKIDVNRRAMILYTSGTTSKPKGVVTTHQNIQAQVTSLVEAWEWRSDDHILHVLPLHHVHGIINVLTCALWVGAICKFLPKFDAKEVWSSITKGNLTLFMAVPTIYEKLIKFWQDSSTEEQKLMSNACSKLRLMVSGSAALPVRTLEEWKKISGHILLERYGMTEVGMALSNPLHGQRRPGYVGTPLPNVEVRLVDDNHNLVGDGIEGEIQVKGPGVFLEYWGNAEATKNAFDDGWFCTGDIAIKEDGIYRILGRSNIDIIKTGGYKVSAIEIEEVLNNHPLIKACAVVGIKDQEWGERVCAALVLKDQANLTLDSLRTWAKEKLAPYKIPKQILIVDDFPRNALGKIIKPYVIEIFKSKERML